MKYEALKKNGERFVKIRPALQLYDDKAQLQKTLEARWWLTQVNSEGATLQDHTLGYSRTISLDHIHHFMSDPDTNQQTRTQGILVLNVQFLIYKNELHIEPTAPPGNPLSIFTPAHVVDDFFSVARRLHEEKVFLEKKRSFESSPEGVNAADKAFYEILSALQEIREALAAQGNEIQFTHKHSGYLILIGANGWWASIEWQRYMNTLQNSSLNIRKWDGHPNFPGTIILRLPTCVESSQYTFELINSSEAYWVDLSNNEYCSSMDIVKNILQEFLSSPTNHPPIF